MPIESNWIGSAGKKSLALLDLDISMMAAVPGGGETAICQVTRIEEQIIEGGINGGGGHLRNNVNSKETQFKVSMGIFRMPVCPCVVQKCC